MGNIKQDEFEILMNIIEGHRYSKEFIRKIFEHENEVLSFEKFEQICQKYNLFDVNTIKKVLEPRNMIIDYEKQYKLICEKIESVLLILRARLEKIGDYDKKWEERLEKYEEKVMKTGENNKKVICWMNKILMDYTEKCVKMKELEKLFPIPLSTICLNMQISNSI